MRQDKLNEQEERERELQAILNASTKNGAQKKETVGVSSPMNLKKQLVLYDLVKSMNQGNCGNVVMRPDMAVKQLEAMEKMGISIDLLYQHISMKR